MIIFIDDEPRAISAYIDAVSAKGFDVKSVSSVAEVNAYMAAGGPAPSCIVLDIMFPGESVIPRALTSAGLTAGMPIFASLRSLFPAVPVIVLTNSSDTTVKSFFDTQDHCAFYYKTEILPFELADVVTTMATDSGQVLLTELECCPRGGMNGRLFETLCVQILEFLFVPPLQRVIPQSRRADGHDIRDAILPNRAHGYFWDSLRREFDAKHIVVEFKNYEKPIGKSEVIQLREYLTRKSLGRFGILISRFHPSESALTSRSDAYTHQNCLILFLDDGDLREMIELRKKGRDPATVLERMKEEFELRY